MIFKTVNGLGRSYCAKRAFDVAMDKALDPSFVDAWVKWFDNATADTPTPEYFAGDLEEVAHATLQLAEIAVRDRYRLRVGNLTAELPADAKEIFAGIAQQMATPGFVEGLLPCE